MNVRRSASPFMFCACVLAACEPGDVGARHAAAIDSLMANITTPGAPGCAVGVYRNGAVVLAKGYGVANIETGAPITPSTPFTLGSVSKQFTALAVLLLAKDNKLSLDDDVRRFVPELRDWGGTIRIRDLLYHTSGIRDYGTLEELSARPVTTMPALVHLVAAQRALNFTPGTAHEYSHSDYVLLSTVVERASGEPFAQYMQRAIFEPLGMSNTRVGDGTTVIPNRAIGHLRLDGAYRARYPVQQLTGGVSVYTTVEDWARWDRNFADGAVGGRDIVDRMTTLPTLSNGDTIPYAYGLKVERYRGTPIVLRGSNSRGTRTEVFRFPEHRVGIAVLCNGGGFDPGSIGKQIADIFLGDVFAPADVDAGEAPPSVAIAPAELAALTGVYRPGVDPWNVIRMDVRDGKLAEILGDTVQTFTHVGNREFAGDGSPPGYRYSFTTRADGGGRIVVSFNGDTLETVERMSAAAEWRPSNTDLAGYGGAYYSVDVDAGWRVSARNAQLVLERRGERDVPLLPVERNVFVAHMGSWEELVTARVEFNRGASGRITHLTVTTPSGEASVRGLRFDRVDVQ